MGREQLNEILATAREGKGMPHLSPGGDMEKYEKAFRKKVHERARDIAYFKERYGATVGQVENEDIQFLRSLREIRRKPLSSNPKKRRGEIQNKRAAAVRLGGLLQEIRKKHAVKQE